jgi:hypothetical protein
MPEGPDAFFGGPIVINGESSGHSAVCLAAAFGADPIVLLGFDMQVVDGLSNWHDDYGFVTQEESYESFRNHFIGWRSMAARAGFSVLNATAGSALSEFPMVDLDLLI